MFFIKGKIRVQDLTAVALIFSAYHRSLMIYFLTPLSAAGAITKKELHDMEAFLKKQMYGLEGDITNDLVQKVLSFHKDPTATVIGKIGTRLRQNLNVANQARPKKNYEETQPLSFE